MTSMEHYVEEFENRDGWVVAGCGCGWESPPCPGAEAAANFWGQHLVYAEAVSP